MKKIFLLMSLTLIVISFSSCANEEIVTTNGNVDNTIAQDDSQLLYSLNLQIDSINNAKFGIPSFYLQESNTNVPLKKFSWKRLWNTFKTIVNADATGASKGSDIGKAIAGTAGGATGAVIGAAGSSLFKAIDIIFEKKDAELQTEKTRSMSTLPIDGIEDSTSTKDLDRIPANCIKEHSIEYTTNDSQSDSIGIYHNRIVKKVLSEYNSLQYWKETDTKEIVEITSIAAEKEMNLPTGTILDNDILKENICTYLDKIKNQTAEEEEANYQKLKTENPKLANILDIIANYINGIAETDDDDASIEYHKNIMKIIEESDLDQTTKEMLNSAINVAFSSANLWDKNYFNE